MLLEDHNAKVSLDISVETPDGGYRSLNWLRNPFGLERWAEKNFRYVSGDPIEPTLWEVVNEVQEPAVMKATVDLYWNALKNLERGYFWFDASGLLNWVIGRTQYIPTSKGTIQGWRAEGGVFCEGLYGIPQEYFTESVWNLGGSSLERYKEWFEQLVELTDLYQTPEAKLYISA